MDKVEIDNKNWQDLLVPLAQKAGIAIMTIYASEFKIELKEDDSPLTEADIASNEIIVEELKKTKIPILSEELSQVDYAERKHWPMFWLVDPIDGTKEFVKKSGEFTVNIALVVDGKPKAGVVYAPAIDLLYYGQIGKGAFRISKGKKEEITTAKTDECIRIVASKSHMNNETKEIIKKIPDHTLVNSGSSLKFCKIADGTADFYPRLGPTMEWDTGAAQAILESAGGIVCRLTGEPLEYNKEDLLNPYFVAAGNKEWLNRFMHG